MLKVKLFENDADVCFRAVLRTESPTLHLKLNNYGRCIEDINKFVVGHCDLLNSMRIHEPNIIYESDEAITTIPFEEAKIQWLKFISNQIEPQLLKLKLSKHEKPIIQEVENRGLDSTTGISQLVLVKFPFFEKNLSQAEKLVQDSSTLFFENGYVEVFSDFMTIDKTNSINIAIIQYEAKDAVEIADLSTTLYHVTLPENVQSILQRGIEPRSQSEKYKYPPRVYLFNNMPLLTMQKYALVKSKMKPFSVVRIDGRLLFQSDEFLSKKIVFYEDPMFFGNRDQNSINPMAIYTRAKIPAKFIFSDYKTFQYIPSEKKVIELQS